jgi:hypothetical protein
MLSLSRYVNALSVALCIGLLQSQVALSAESDIELVHVMRTDGRPLTVKDTDAGDIVFFGVKRSSIQVRNRRLSGWVLLDFTSAQKAPSTGALYKSALILFAVDCANERYGALSMITYSQKSAEGNVVASASLDGDHLKMEYAVPSTAAHSVLKYICTQASTAQ